MKHFRKSLGWLLLLFLCASGLWLTSAQAQIPAAINPKMPDIQILQPQTQAQSEPIRSLFYRQPWSFGPETFDALLQLALKSPAYLQARLQQLIQSEKFFYLAALGLGLLMLFWLLERRLQALPSRYLHLLPAHWPFGIQRLAKILLMVAGRSALLLLLIFVVHMLWGSAAEEAHYFPLIISCLWIFAAYRACQTLLREVLLSERLSFFAQVPERNARYLYWRLNGFALFSALCGCWLVLLNFLEARADLSELFQYIYFGCLMAFSSSLIARKQEVFRLFPEIDEPLYQRFILYFQRFYLYVAGYTILLGLLWIAGYQQLAGILFLRSWALVGLVLALRLGHRLLNQLLQHYLSAAAQVSSRLVTTISQALTLVEVLLVCQGALSLLGIRDAVLQLLSQPIATIGDKSVISPWSLLGGLLTLAIFWFCARILEAFLQEKVFPQRFEAHIEQMIEVSCFYTLMAIGCLMALNVVGLDLSLFAIFAGALAFGIGFGLQGIAKNFASGLILIFTGLVKKGDYITVSGHTGYIQDVSWKKVHLRTPDHVDLIIPTVDLVETTIVNWSYSGKEVRVHVPIFVAYQSDLNQVKKALLEAAQEHPAVFESPQPEVWLTSFADSAIRLELLVWIDATQITREKLIGELNFMIWNAFQRHQIEIPYPQQDLHLRSGWEVLQKQASERIVTLKAQMEAAEQTDSEPRIL